MSISTLVERWNRTHKLEGIRSEFLKFCSTLRVPVEISQTRRFTLGQIQHCFDSTFLPVTMIVAREKNVASVSVEEAIEGFRAKMLENDFVELLLETASTQNASDRELLRDLDRFIKNLQWRKRAGENE